MKITKTYNLAKSSKRISLPNTTSIPECSPQRNIFAQEKKKWHGRELDTSKHYEIVGLKELKSYQNRLKKASRATIRMDSLSTDRPTSKTSSEHKKTTLQLLTKEEVIDCLPKILHIEEQTSEVEPKVRIKRKRQSWMTFSTDIINAHQTAIPRPTKQSNQFSLNRIKRRMMEHRKEWSSHHYHEDSKFPNIYKSIELHRLKLEQREEQGRPNEDLVITRSNFWGETLRNQKQMSHICCKKNLAKTFHDENSFIAKGHSKMDLQKSWLERKDEAGFKFKLIPEEIPEEMKKTVVIR